MTARKNQDASQFRRLDPICDQFEMAWHKALTVPSSKRPRIEDYLSSVPDDGLDALLHELLAIEIELRRHAGETPTRWQYRDRFPQSVGIVVSAFEEHAESDVAKSAERGDASTEVTASQVAGDPTVDYQADRQPRLPDQESVSADPDDDPPQSIGNYHLVNAKALGGGTQGTVYHYRHKYLVRDCAIKLSRAGQVSSNAKDLLLAEACYVAELDLPNFVRIFDSGPLADGRVFIAMELVKGKPIHQLTRDRTPGEIAESILRIARALEAVHERHILHRDIKPDNILVDQTGDPKLVDFGFSLRVDDQPDADGSTVGQVGSPGFMAPEVVSGDSYSTSADVYSLGATLYYLLTARTTPVPIDSQWDLNSPNRDHWVAYAERLASCEPVLPRQLNADIPTSLQDVCLKALERDAGTRYATATEFADDLQRFLDGRPVLATPLVYNTKLATEIDQTIQQVGTWEQHGLVSARERDFLVAPFRQLVDTEGRRASLPDWVRLRGWEVLLLVGALLFAVGPATMVGFEQMWTRFPGESVGRSVFVLACCMATVVCGLVLWSKGLERRAIPILTTSVFLVVLTLYTVLHSAWTGSGDATFGKWVRTVFLEETVAQAPSPNWDSLFLISVGGGLVAAAVALFWTRAAIFTWMCCILGSLTTWAVYLSFLDWRPLLPHVKALLFFPIGAVLLGLGYGLECSHRVLPARKTGWSRAAYITGFVVLLISWFRYAVAKHPGVYFGWEGDEARMLSFYVGGLLVLVLAILADIADTPALRRLSVAPFVVGGLFSLCPVSALIIIHIKERPSVWEFTLLLNCAYLIYLSVARQRKNLLYQGSAYLLISVIQITYTHYREDWRLPVCLVLVGSLIMALAILRAAQDRSLLRGIASRGFEGLQRRGRAFDGLAVGGWIALTLMLLVLGKPPQAQTKSLAPSRVEESPSSSEELTADVLRDLSRSPVENPDPPQASGGTPDPPSRDWAERLFKSSRFSVDIVAGVGKTIHRISITNPHQHPVHLSQVRSDAQHLIPLGVQRRENAQDNRSPKNAREVLASATLAGGDSAVIAFLIDSSRLHPIAKAAGRQTSLLTVVFDEPQVAVVHIPITVFIRGDVEVIPDRVDFGNVPVGMGAARIVRVTFPRNGSWRISRPTSGSSHLETNLRIPPRPDQEAAAAAVVEVKIQLKETAPAGRFFGEVTLTLKKDHDVTTVEQVERLVARLRAAAEMQRLLVSRVKLLAEANGLLGKTYKAIGKDEQAAESFLQATEQRRQEVLHVKQLAEVEHLVGVLLLKIEKSDEAEDQFRLALKLNPDLEDSSAAFTDDKACQHPDGIPLYEHELRVHVRVTAEIEAANGR